MLVALYSPLSLLVDKFCFSPASWRRVVPSCRLFLKSGCNSDNREPASEQVFRRDQWALCTHVCASQCDINIAIIIYVLSLHPRWDAQIKPTRKHPPPCTRVHAVHQTPGVPVYGETQVRVVLARH